MDAFVLTNENINDILNHVEYTKIPLHYSLLLLTYLYGGVAQLGERIYR